MKTFTCAQRGCEFEAEELPEKCLVCENPMIDADAIDVEVPWTEYTKAELIEQCKEWEVDIDGPASRVPKAALIAALEAVEAAADAA